MNSIDQSAIYDVVAGMLQDAVPLKKNKKTFGPDTLLDDIGMDSLEVLSVAMDLEEHYDVFIPDEEINGFKKVEDIAIYLADLLKKKAEAPEPEIEVEADSGGGGESADEIKAAPAASA